MMHYRHLTDSDRNVIEKLLKNKKTKKEIAQILDYDPGTISREITRNKSGEYYARSAIQIAKMRRRKSKHKKLMNNKLRDYVLSKLKHKWSPEAIANRIKLEFPEDKTMRISYESIYIWIYNEKSLGNDEFYKYLMMSHKQRQNRGNIRKIRALRTIIKDKKSIHSRPEQADNRSRIGHWEGDTIEGRCKDGYISTFVCRKGRYLIAQKMENKRAETLCRSAFEGFSEIPNKLIKTMTFDNGSEFSQFKSLEDAFECEVYFADPYSSWQRGTNEYTNRLLRGFFPKKMSFKNLEQKDIDYAVNLINNRPRKCLNYRTPHEVFFGKKIALQG